MLGNSESLRRNSASFDNRVPAARVSGIFTYPKIMPSGRITWTVSFRNVPGVPSERVKVN